MVELMSYGLTGLTAMLVMAFCFAYGDELRRAVATIKSFTADGLFIGQSPKFLSTAGNGCRGRFRSALSAVGRAYCPLLRIAFCLMGAPHLKHGSRRLPFTNHALLTHLSTIN